MQIMSADRSVHSTHSYSDRNLGLFKRHNRGVRIHQILIQIALQQQQRCEARWRHVLEMNLYRSFGNLMEAWVYEEIPGPDSEWLGNNAKDALTPSSDMGTNLRSESVDSGVETASCDTSLPATPQREGLTPGSKSQSPVLSSPVLSSSSSSPHLCPSRAEEGSSDPHLKVEQALQRTDSKHLLKDDQKPLTVDEVLCRRPRASFLPKRHTSELVRGQRSEVFGVRRPVSSIAPIRQMSDLGRRPLSMCCDTQRSEGLGGEERKELSPGLSYLEQVCQMLEEIARQQMHNRALQMEMDALREHQDAQVPDTCQSDSPAAEEEDVSSCQRVENTENAEQSSTETQRRKYGHFRQRSASDTTLAQMHLRRLNDYRGQHLSSDDLLEEAEEDQEKQESTKKETTKTKKNWRLNFLSLRGLDSAAFDTNGQQMQSSERNSARRRLSQLFRRRRKTILPE